MFYTFQRKRNKKGNIIADSFIIVLILIIFAISAPFIYKIMFNFNANIQDNSMYSATAKTTTQTITTQMPLWMDNALLGAFILLWVGAIIASFLVDSHPAFFVLIIILWIALLIGFAALSNAYGDMMASDNISTFSASFPKTQFIMSHLVEFMIAVGVSIAISLFAKSRQG